MDNQGSTAEPRTGSGWKIVLLSCGGCLLLCTVLIAAFGAIVIPMMARAQEDARSAGCLGNMRQLGVALRLYAEDYSGRLPSVGRGVNEGEFETTVGNPCPDARGTWAEAIFRYVREKRVYDCPSDFNGKGKRSYCYKHAVDLAAKVGFALADLPYGSRQILLYEREPFHHGRGPIVERSTLNVLRVDMHASTIQITNVAQDREPRYFNYLDKSSQYAAKAKKPYWDPRCCYDMLPN